MSSSVRRCHRSLPRRRRTGPPPPSEICGGSGGLTRGRGDREVVQSDWRIAAPAPVVPPVAPTPGLTTTPARLHPRVGEPVDRLPTALPGPNPFSGVVVRGSGNPGWVVGGHDE